jgi:hypothetical protein
MANVLRRCAESGENLGRKPAHEETAQTSHMLDGRLVNGLAAAPPTFAVRLSNGNGELRRLDHA